MGMGHFSTPERVAHMSQFNVGFMVGSISSTSINRRLASALARLAPEAGLTFTEIPIAGLPFYSADHDAGIPAAAAEFKQAIADADAVVIVTPEYNRSIPGVLKNALDTASRPWGQNSMAGKPTAVIGTSIGQLGTAASQQHLRLVLSFLDAPTMSQPEAYVQERPGQIADDGTIDDAGARAFYLGWLSAVRDHIAQVRGK